MAIYLCATFNLKSKLAEIIYKGTNKAKDIQGRLCVETNKQETAMSSPLVEV